MIVLRNLKVSRVDTGLLDIVRGSLFKRLRDHRRHSDRPAVIQCCDGGFLGDWDDGGVFEAGGGPHTAFKTQCNTQYVTRESGVPYVLP